MAHVFVLEGKNARTCFNLLILLLFALLVDVCPEHLIYDRKRFVELISDCVCVWVSLGLSGSIRNRLVFLSVG